MKDWWHRLKTERVNPWSPYDGAFGQLVNVIFWGSLIIVVVIYFINH
jgi:hypothetical protein